MTELQRVEDKQGKKYKPFVLDGKEYYSIKQIAGLSKRSELAIRVLLSVGNRLGKLEHIRFNTTSLVPVEAFHKFWFTSAGKCKTCYRYDEKGKEETKEIE